MQTRENRVPRRENWVPRRENQVPRENRESAAREVLHWDAAAVPARGLGLFWLDPSSTQHYGTDAVRRQGFQHHCVGRADDILIWHQGPSSAGTACGYEASWHSDVLGLHLNDQKVGVQWIWATISTQLRDLCRSPHLPPSLFWEVGSHSISRWHPYRRGAWLKSF